MTLKNIIKRSLLPFLCFCFLTTCQKVEFKIDDVPNCFKKKVRNDDLSRIQKWEVDNQTFYLISYQNCGDCFNELYDEDCDYVCAPSGGIAGAGDGNCPTWNGTIAETLIWEAD